ncbi:hypothetical protein PGH12_06090 [Chryseobacterium wangxinyae]|uniref:hypothetical protein n=1 Tax=Chryseobacterium sp. CY350 TaxID=2997336 RepID=UPI00226DD5B7|nr:hypothetical protein [Chryseobacterium sp. CY350]MCY0976718.1 hypothetical protein [Chryseobacterium sp. CY350]WBZ96719.1 hypothetical protein PGH12_06090 [Chryseobacterium sp. CY350]
MISLFFNDNFNSLTLKNLKPDFEQCRQMFLDVMKHSNNSLGIIINEKTVQFYKEKNNKILVEIINSNMINNQMFADVNESIDIIKSIYEKHLIEVLPNMKLINIKVESLEDVLDKE